MTKLIERPKAYGNSIFCDDIRLEIGNKVTFIGVYTNGMTVNVPFPATLPKFAIWVSWSEKPDAFEPSDGLRIKVFLPGQKEDGEAAVDVDYPIGDHRSLPISLGPPPDKYSEAFRRVEIPINFMPLILNEVGHIKVRAFIGDEVVALGSLKVDQVLPETNPTPSQD